jgi:hypothetical protein
MLTKAEEEILADLIAVENRIVSEIKTLHGDLVDIKATVNYLLKKKRKVKA